MIKPHCSSRPDVTWPLHLPSLLLADNRDTQRRNRSILRRTGLRSKLGFIFTGVTLLLFAGLLTLIVVLIGVQLRLLATSRGYNALCEIRIRIGDIVHVAKVALQGALL